MLDANQLPQLRNHRDDRYQRRGEVGYLYVIFHFCFKFTYSYKITQNNKKVNIAGYSFRDLELFQPKLRQLDQGRHEQVTQGQFLLPYEYQPLRSSKLLHLIQHL